MTALQILAAGIAHVCTPGPQAGWPHAVQALLDQRDTAARAEGTAEYGTRPWLEANAARIAAECHLARHLGITDGPEACTGCGHNDPDDLTPGPSGDPYCTDCHTTHAEASPHAY